MHPLKITAAFVNFLIHHKANIQMAENIKHIKTAQFCGFTAARVLAAGGSAAEWTSTVEPVSMGSPCTLFSQGWVVLGCLPSKTPVSLLHFHLPLKIAERVWESNKPHCLWFNLRYHSWQRLLAATLLQFLIVTNKNVISTLQLIHFIFCCICSFLHFSNSCVCL